jgi:hypothetical protein
MELRVASRFPLPAARCPPETFHSLSAAAIAVWKLVTPRFESGKLEAGSWKLETGSVYHGTAR